MWQRILDGFFPRKSLGGEDGAWVTQTEWRRMRTGAISVNEATLRSRGVIYLDGLVAASTYDDAPLIKTALRRFKYGGVRGLECELSQLLADAMRLLPHADAPLVPVPLHWRRRFKRGFNQSLLLARGAGKFSQRPVALLLKRVRSTGQQAKRNRSERMSAMRNAFAVCTQKIPTHVVLVDDVATTCATLDACACALKKAGVQRVDALVVALG